MSTTGQPQPDAAATPAGRTRSAGRTLLVWAGSLGPFGYLPASGTLAVAFAGVPLCWFMARHLSWGRYAAATAAFTVAAMAMHHAGDRILGESDSRKLVWDELVGYLIAMFLVPWSWKLAIIGFFVERGIDILKVPPANVIDRKMHNGVGVVLDDVVAGVYTCALLHGLRVLAPALAA